MKPVFSTKGLLIAGATLAVLGAVWFAAPGSHPYLTWLILLLVLAMLLKGFPAVQSQWSTILNGG